MTGNIIRLFGEGRAKGMSRSPRPRSMPLAGGGGASPLSVERTQAMRPAPPFSPIGAAGRRPQRNSGSPEPRDQRIERTWERTLEVWYVGQNRVRSSMGPGAIVVPATPPPPPARSPPSGMYLFDKTHEKDLDTEPEVTKCILMFLAHNRLRHGLKAWKRVVGRRRAQDLRMTFAAREWLKRARHRSWRKWRSLMIRRRALQLAASSHRELQLRRPWSTWRMLAHRQQRTAHRRALLRATLTRQSRQGMRWALDRLASRVRHAKMQMLSAAMLQRRVRGATSRALRSVLGLWRYIAHEKLRSHYLDYHGATSFVRVAERRAFNSWIASVGERYRRRGLEAKAARVFCHRGERLCLNSWQRFTSERHRKRQLATRGLSSMTNRLERAGWNGWMELVRARHRKAALSAQAIRSLRNRHGRAAWNTWCELVAHAVHCRRIARRGLMALTHRHQRTGWNS